MVFWGSGSVPGGGYPPLGGPIGPIYGVCIGFLRFFDVFWTPPGGGVPPIFARKKGGGVSHMSHFSAENLAYMSGPEKLWKKCPVEPFFFRFSEMSPYSQSGF